MGFFEFLNKKVDAKPKKEKKTEAERQENEQDDYGFDRKKYAHIDEFRPRSFDDVAGIIDCLLDNKPALVFLTEVRDTTAQRVLDILSGAAYALYSKICEVGEETYLITTDKK